MRKKLIIGIIASVVTLMLLMGSVVAMFSDSDIIKLGGKVGNVQVTQENLELQKEYGVNDYGAVNGSTPIISKWNPGDTNILRWKVVNRGNKSVDTRNTIVIYWDEPTPNTSEQAKDIKEWGSIYLYPTKHSNGTAYTNAQVKANILTGSASDALIKVDSTLITTPTGSRWGYVYTTKGDSLAGVGTDAENTNSDWSEAAYPNTDDGVKYEDYLEYQLAFHPHAPVTFMNYKFVVKVITEAKQHRNTADSDWQLVTP